MFNKYNSSDVRFVTPGKQVEYISRSKPNEVAIIEIDEFGNVKKLTWKELHKKSNSLANFLIKNNISQKDDVLVGYPNGIDHIIATLAIWKAGACYMPVSPQIRKITLDSIKKEIQFKISFSNFSYQTDITNINSKELNKIVDDFDDNTPKDIFSNPNMASLSGGTSGKLKIIRQNMPSGLSDDLLRNWFEISGMNFDKRQLLLGPLAHGAPHSVCFNGLFSGNQLIIPRNINPDNIVKLIQEYKVQYFQTVPTVLNRILRVKGINRQTFSSVEALCHTGGVCSEKCKQKWMDLLGPEKVYEIYSMTEVIGLTSIRGDEWLKHRHSVGRPLNDGCICIRDEDGKEVPTGEIGEIYMRPPTGCFMTEYIQPNQIKHEFNGLRSVGDLGFVDEDGYLYFVNRRSDLLVTGGENVYASEVEKALLKDDDIRDAVVVGIPDEEWGQKIYALIETDKRISQNEVKQFLRPYLLPYKIPKYIDVVRQIPRNDNGKVNKKEIIESYMRKEELSI